MYDERSWREKHPWIYISQISSRNAIFKLCRYFSYATFYAVAIALAVTVTVCIDMIEL